jgi:hypothetical protein
VFIPLLIVFEAAAGALILGRAYRRIGITAAIAFNAALVLFGSGFCLWSVPVVALLLRFWHLEAIRRRTAGRCTGQFAVGTNARLRDRVLGMRMRERGCTRPRIRDLEPR